MLFRSPARDEVKLEDFLTTVYHQLGIDAHEKLMAFGGTRPIEIVKDGKVIATLQTTPLREGATDDGTTGVFIVERGANGLSLEAQATTTGELEYRVTLAGVTVTNTDKLGDGKRD